MSGSFQFFSGLFPGGYVFNTEAHPIDIAALYCCSASKLIHDAEIEELSMNSDLLAVMGIGSPHDSTRAGKKPKRSRDDSKLVDSFFKFAETEFKIDVKESSPWNTGSHGGHFQYKVPNVVMPQDVHSELDIPIPTAAGKDVEEDEEKEDAASERRENDSDTTESKSEGAESDSVRDVLVSDTAESENIESSQRDESADVSESGTSSITESVTTAVKSEGTESEEIKSEWMTTSQASNFVETNLETVEIASPKVTHGKDF